MHMRTRISKARIEVLLRTVHRTMHIWALSLHFAQVSWCITHMLSIDWETKRAAEDVGLAGGVDASLLQGAVQALHLGLELLQAVRFAHGRVPVGVARLR